MKIFIDKDDLYPVYKPSETGNANCLGTEEVEVSARTLNYWKSIWALFGEMQSELADLYEQAEADSNP